MSKNDILKGVILVALGATSYGMLATVVKLAYLDHFTTSEVTTAQFVYGILGVFVLFAYQKFTKKTIEYPSSNDKKQLILAGTSLGLTSVFYYLCVKYINVSTAIVLLMQTVWMGVLLEWILYKVKPNTKKIIAVALVIIGTLLATKILEANVVFDWRGLLFGLLAAMSFTTTMWTANKIAVQANAYLRSLYMLFGGAIIVAFFVFYSFEGNFNFAIFGNYGLFLAFFGTIIPPILLNAGFPKTGIGLGSIVASLELPVSVFMAYLLLHENVQFLQWMGVGIILFAIIIMNIKFKK